MANKTTNLNWATAVTYWIGIGFWVHGIAVAKGFWMTLLSVVFPPVAYVISAGWISDIISKAIS